MKKRSGKTPWAYPVGFPRTTSTSGSPRGRIGIRYTIKSTIAKILRWFWLLCFVFYSSRRDFNLRQLRLRGFFVRKKKSHFGFFLSFLNKKKMFLWISCCLFFFNWDNKSRVLLKKVWTQNWEGSNTKTHVFIVTVFRVCIYGCIGDSNFELFISEYFINHPVLDWHFFCFVYSFLVVVVVGFLYSKCWFKKGFVCV